jgi:peptide/nickel transport system substrate-binding protein
MSTLSWNARYLGTISRRRFLKSTAAGAGAVALIACGGGGGDSSIEGGANPREPGSVWFAASDWKLPDETKEAVRGGIYRGHASEGQDGHFDAIMLMSSQVPANLHTNELLMGRNRGPGIDPRSTAAGNPAGMLAEGWEIAPDGMSITFTMRQGVKWHDKAPVNGRVMDMDDWRTSQERHIAGGVYRQAIIDILDRVDFPDARRMVWRLKYPFAPIFDRIYHDKFAYPIQPKELNTNVALAEQTSIGTGYKILDKYQPELAFEYRKHPEYWGGDPFIDRWQVPIIPEYANRYAQFLNGNIIDFTPTARDVLLMHRDAPEAVIVAEPIPEASCTRMRWGRIDPANQAWADPRVRVAVRRSIDFLSIGKFLSNQAEFEKAGIPVELTPMTHLPQQPAYWLNPEKGELGPLSANYLYDVAEAKKLTAAAGHNQPIPLPYFVALSDGEIPESDQLVIDSLQGAGTFALNITRVPTAAEHNKYRIEGLFDGLIPQSGSTDDADYFVMREYHTDGRVGGRGLQNQAYPDPRIDAVGEAQRKELDIEKRAEILKEFQRIAAELMPAVPGRHLYTSFAFRWPWVHNLGWGTTSGNWTGSGSPIDGQPVSGGHLQWLDKDMPNRDTGAT